MTDKLMSYLPAYYRKSALTRQVQNGVAAELGGIDATLNYILSSIYVTTADAAAIARYEAIVGLRAGAHDLETRRARVLARLRGYETSTVAVIERVASRFLGCPVTAVEINGEYRFYLNFERTVENRGDVAAMREAVEEIKPAHLGWGYADALRLPTATRSLFAAGAMYDPTVQTYLPPIERVYAGKIGLLAAVHFSTSLTIHLPVIPAGED